MVATVIAAGANIETSEWDGTKPLRHAVRSADLATFGALLNHGADMNAQLSSGPIPLHYWAWREGKEENTSLADTLLRPGVERDSGQQKRRDTGGRGWPPQIRAQRGMSSECISFWRMLRPTGYGVIGAFCYSALLTAAGNNVVTLLPRLLLSGLQLTEIGLFRLIVGHLYL